MMNRNLVRAMVLCISLFVAGFSLAGDSDQSLVTVGEYDITAAELDQAMSSSPYAVQFNAMDEDEQATLRGNMLKHLVGLHLLRLEAESMGLADTPEFRADLDEFANGLLYRYYMDHLRSKITVPDDVEEELRAEYAGQPDALDAARSSYIVNRYRALKTLTVQTLIDRANIRLYEDRIAPGISDGTVLLEADDFVIRYGDIVEPGQFDEMPSAEWIKDRLYQKAELLLIANAARKENVDVTRELESFRNERLPAMLRERLEDEWTGDEAVVRKYYDDHPEIARTPTLWHLGMLVTDSYTSALYYRGRIYLGESLFTLAGENSIDPYGRQHNGDMGWVQEGTGMPEIESVLDTLEDGEVSDIIETPRGYHIVTVLERRPGKVRAFATMKDKVKQMIIDEKMPEYLNALQEKYGVKWHIIKQSEDLADSGAQS